MPLRTLRMWSCTVLSLAFLALGTTECSSGTGEKTTIKKKPEKTPEDHKAPLEGWKQQAYVKAFNAAEYDELGNSVSLFGDTLAVGASTDTGAVYVYRREGTDWTQEAHIKAVNAHINDNFGGAVALSGDTLAVGAPWESNDQQTTITNGTTASTVTSGLRFGAVYLYRRAGTSWTQEAYVKAANAGLESKFGDQVSVSGDTLAVGSSGEGYAQTTITNGTTASRELSATDSGAVYVYRRTGSTWAQEAYIKAANAEQDDNFGAAVSLSGDTLAVGAINESSSQTTITNGASASSDNVSFRAGAVYVFRRTGSTWAQEAYVKASNADPYDNFGESLSLSGDTLAVGTQGESSSQTTITNGTQASTDNSVDHSGAVYLYRRAGNTWQQEAFVKGPTQSATACFGRSVSLLGNTLVVGEPGNIYVFQRSGLQWMQEISLKGANSVREDDFGGRLALSGDTLAVGARYEDSGQTTITNGLEVSADDTLRDSGAVFLFKSGNRLFDPHVFVTERSSTSISFKWGSNLGTTTAVKVASAVTGTQTPEINCSGGVVLSAVDKSYTYEGLTPSTKYGFRFCAWDGANASIGTTIWEDTAP